MSADAIEAHSEELEAMGECPACAGTGRQSDRMPNIDAICDAATLFLEACTFGDGLNAINGNLKIAARWAHQTIKGGRGRFVRMLDRNSGLWGRTYREPAELAAHAAFRAVPGLRGEE